MMVALCVLAVLGLAVCGILMSRGARSRPELPESPSVPPLPPRRPAGLAASSGGTAVPPSLPPRRSSPAAGVLRQGRVGENRGPRGIRPAQFPCCPLDKQRNVPGGRQVIFWDSGANCYCCSRGHRFKSNGKLL